MKKGYVKKRHKFYFAVMRPVARILAHKYHFKTKPIKFKKGEQYLIFSNHQGVLDPVFLAYSFKAPIYFVAADSLFSTKLYSRLLVHCFAPVKKRKNMVDFSCMRTLKQIANEGGSVAIFPEGNRAWCDFQFHIDKSVCKLVRLLKLPLLLYNFSGGYGVNPRWSENIRKGEHRGFVRKIIPWEQIQEMSDEQLFEEIRFNLKVIDSDSGKLFKSKRRAEFLERQLFVCPKCKSVNTLHSNKNTITCSHCNLQVEYCENLHLKSNDEAFTFHKLVEWWQFQQEFVRQFKVVPGEIIFSDENVTLLDKTTSKQTVVAKGKLVLTSQTISVGEFCLPLDEVVSASAVGGRKFDLNTAERALFVVGEERFNPIKYLLFFNILCKNTATKGDNYYGLSMDNGSV